VVNGPAVAKKTTYNAVRRWKRQCNALQCPRGGGKMSMSLGGDGEGGVGVGGGGGGGDGGCIA
jgi:hypothetical protein